MFINNKYTNIYNKIINRAKLQQRIKSDKIYYESHHILPKSLGGSNDIENKVLLTFKEHYICHRLLPKMVATKQQKTKMNYALYMMKKISRFQDRSLSHHQRMICLEANRKACRNRSHRPNLGNKHSEETKQLIREKAKGRKHSEESIQKIKENNIRTNKSRGKKTSVALAGKKKSEEHKRKISDTLKRKHYERKMVAEIGFEPMTPGM